jgi:hypothetical protein
LYSLSVNNYNFAASKNIFKDETQIPLPNRDDVWRAELTSRQQSD